MMVTHLESEPTIFAGDWTSSSSVQLIVDLRVSIADLTTIGSNDVTVDFNDRHFLDIGHSSGLVGVGSSLRIG